MRLTAPVGINQAFGIDGKIYRADPHGVIYAADIDVPSLLSAGWRQVETVSNITADYICDDNDRLLYIRADHPIQITLPIAPFLGLRISIKDALGNLFTHNATVISLDHLIDGQPSFVMNANWQAQDLSWNGSGWSVH